MMSFIQLMIDVYLECRRPQDVHGDHNIWFMGYEYPICQRWIPKCFPIGHVLRMSQNVFKHQLTQIEFSLYADLEEYGSKTLYYPRVMSCQHLIAHCNLV